MVNIREAEARRDFFSRAYYQIGDTLTHIHKSRANGDVVFHEPGEIAGEAPHSDVPGQIILAKDELNPTSSRLQAIKAFLQSHNLKKELHNHRRIVIVASTATGGAVAIIGGYFAVKHFINKNPHSDITDI